MTKFTRRISIIKRHVFSPTVRGAAQEVVTTGINEAMRTDGNRQRPPIN